MSFTSSFVRALCGFGAVSALAATPRPASAQAVPLVVSRAEAIRLAVLHGPRNPLAAADTVIAAAGLFTSRLRPDPTGAMSYSKAPPNFHFTLELPIDIPGVRGLRIRSAELLKVAAQYRFDFAQANAALDADTAYTRALLTTQVSIFSAANARAADSLRHLAVLRADAGDAAQLDVEVATLFAGQQANLAAADSLAQLQAMHTLQRIMGVAGPIATITLTDSLTSPAPIATQNAVPPLSVAAATAARDAAGAAVTQQQRSRIPWPALLVGFDAGDSDLKGVLPVIGLSFPLPFFSGNRGDLAIATAERSRAEAELTTIAAEIEATAVATKHTIDAMPSRIARDKQLIESADRIAGMSLVAYREGATPLANVLEAQRTIREVRTQYLNDLAEANIAAAIYRALSASPSSGHPR